MARDTFEGTTLPSRIGLGTVTAGLIVFDRRPIETRPRTATGSTVVALGTVGSVGSATRITLITDTAVKLVPIGTVV